MSAPSQTPELPISVAGHSFAPAPGSASLPPILDACCGSRMFWFDKHDPRALFVDIRRETWVTDNRPGRSATVVNPDVLADFSNLPFPDSSFALVIFDPPHLVRNGKQSRTSRKYGDLKGDWREMIRKGFAECFRVLKPEGTVVRAESEQQVFSLCGVPYLHPHER
jgi:SAM-dependent methyltransferase